jgi:hypothetical protein
VYCSKWLNSLLLPQDSFFVQVPVVQASQHVSEQMAAKSDDTEDPPNQEPSLSLGGSPASPSPLPLARPIWRGKRRPGGHGYPRRALTDIEQRDAERYIVEMRNHFREVSWMIYSRLAECGLTWGSSAQMNSTFITLPLNGKGLANGLGLTECIGCGRCNN